MESGVRYGWRGVAVAAAVVPALGLCGCSGASGGIDSAPTTSAAASAGERFAGLESRRGVRLGVFAVNGRGDRVGYRQDERFAFASSFKALACGALLREHPLDTGYFDRVVRYAGEELVANSPVTRDHVNSGMTVDELCLAAITRSDNTAGNQLLKLLGGPPALTEFLRSIGDEKTRSDRWEIELNTAVPGDDRDTTTPAALAADYRALTVGNILGPAERDRLNSWLVMNTTGGQRIRAGVPADWRVGDKTGTGEYGSAVDVAVAWTGRGEPVVIALLSTKPDRHAEADDELLAEATRIVVDALG
ncbi:class A beta-lactamase [Nocardia sp. BMG51109]|uniref:class A beta-lactamase n=1 Tax=Nocardia sp. BMG51109 TaxID=1056816 RepID=UPI000464B05B|nr:class A beta-lactamase [Nocardia sp. BMG51109]